MTAADRTSMTLSATSPLLIDLEGPSLTRADRARLLHPRVGGVIHFSRHWQGREAMRELNAQIKALRPDLLICVDHEGGRVQRFRTDGLAHLPAMGRLGALWMDDAMAAQRAAVACGEVLGAELRAIGVDFSFAPVLDLDRANNPVVGDRSFHRDPRVVAVLGRCVAHGLLRAGLAHCGKHFPGHGYTRVDSHVGMPVDGRSLQAILAEDGKPFEWLMGTLVAVMPGHVIYPKVDERPAGFSPRWLQEILRGRFGFEGVIVSDDLGMAAARRLGGRELDFAQAAVAALGAGCDLTLVCNQSLEGGAALDRLLERFDAEAEAAGWQPDAAAASRLARLVPRTPPLEWQALQDDPAYRAARRCLDTLPDAG